MFGLGRTEIKGGFSIYEEHESKIRKKILPHQAYLGLADLVRWQL